MRGTSDVSGLFSLTPVCRFSCSASIGRCTTTRRRTTTRFPSVTVMSSSTLSRSMRAGCTAPCRGPASLACCRQITWSVATRGTEIFWGGGGRGLRMERGGGGGGLKVKTFGRAAGEEVHAGVTGPGLWLQLMGA